MDVKDRIRGESEAQVPDQAGCGPSLDTSTDYADAGRWRLSLEHRWSRKLDEVIILTAACEDAPTAGDDILPGTALSARRLHERAATAYEELGELADAIARVDSWLAQHRAARSL